MVIKWCVIGAGGIADRRTIPALISSEDNLLCAVMDTNPEVSKSVGEKYGVPHFTSEEEMLQNCECDAVYISTPVFCHYDQAMTALKYGKHVFLEKPITLYSKEAEDLVYAFKKAKKQLSIGYMMKYHNLHKKAHDIVKRNGIGRISDVRLQFSCWYPDIAGAWRQKKELSGGGALMDLGVHCIELIEYILEDEICETKAFLDTISFSYEVEDSAVVIFKTKKGTLGHIDVNFNIPDRASESKLELYGEDGYIICYGTLAQEETGTLHYLRSTQGEYEAQQSRSSEKPKKYKGRGSNLYSKQLKSFTDLISAGKTNYYYAKRAVQVQRIVDKIYLEDKENNKWISIQR